MIAVIADDFTGAAEIGGIGLQYGLKVLIETEVTGSGDPDLLIVAADTRSMDADEASDRIERLTTQVVQLGPSFIYKKIDSVLRGNVYEELVSQQTAEGKSRVLIIPANPHFNRVVKDGIYYVNNTPLSETSFANDPEFPLQSSDVRDIVGDAPALVECLDPTDDFADASFIVGNVSTAKDLTLWTDRIDDRTVCGGGAGFFEAILKKHYSSKRNIASFSSDEKKHSLFIFGSTFPKTHEFLKKMKRAGMMFINLSENYFELSDKDLNAVQEMAENIASWINQERKVVVTTLFTDSEKSTISPDRVREEVGLLVKKIFDLTQIQELYIEGGATASQIFQNLEIASLKPVRELDYGIIQMEVENYPGLSLVTKPGSYIWPESIIPDKKNIFR